MQILPSVKSPANFAGSIINTGRKANDIIMKNTPKKNKIAKFYQFYAAVCASYTLFVRPLIELTDFYIPFVIPDFIDPKELDKSPLLSSSEARMLPIYVFSCSGFF